MRVGITCNFKIADALTLYLCRFGYEANFTCNVLSLRLIHHATGCIYMPVCEEILPSANGYSVDFDCPHST